ncbi:hypothetical protein B0T19DRAFT_433080 [Cercophora scortea]|uniref:Uncharacterized protein n=1 Tax=Cercophora scortea TaxID=314031 RepID=A0AAE0I801_9PEZI|nr:hypothetical protein B0T19DRAFT_433080 [Cercophora scortea]
MAPKKSAKSRGGATSSTTTKPTKPLHPPPPLQLAPDSLKPFTSHLSPSHVYIAHVDGKPASFKRKIFLVPVAMNLIVAALFLWRVWYIGPYYIQLLQSTLGTENATTLRAADLTRTDIAYVVLRRTATFIVDFLLVVFVWPWPLEFLLGGSRIGGGSPVFWRWAVGFRDREIYVRRSRSWDKEIGDVVKSANTNGEAEGGGGRNIFWGKVRDATAPLLLQEKTGYLTMNADWDLDWAAMVEATQLVDAKVLPLVAFKVLVLLHHNDFGWLCVDLDTGGSNAKEEERRKHVFAFRDALAAVGKEDLFFRWIEVIQFETSQPQGFTAERQLEVAQKVRDLFKENGIDFDEFWKESVGSDPMAGV